MKSENNPNLSLRIAFLQPLPPYPNTLAFSAAINTEWFMSPALWTRHIVTSQIVNTSKFTDSIKYRCIRFLQDVDSRMLNILLVRSVAKRIHPSLCGIAPGGTKEAEPLRRNTHGGAQKEEEHQRRSTKRGGTQEEEHHS